MTKIQITDSSVAAEAIAAHRLVADGVLPTFEEALAYVRKSGDASTASQVRKVRGPQAEEHEAQRLVAIGAQPNLDVARDLVRAKRTHEKGEMGGGSVTGKISQAYADLFKKEPRLLEEHAKAQRAAQAIAQEIAAARYAAINVVTGREERILIVQSCRAQLEILEAGKRRMGEKRDTHRYKFHSKLRKIDSIHWTQLQDMAGPISLFELVIRELDTLIVLGKQALADAEADLAGYLETHAAELQLVDRN